MENKGVRAQVIVSHGHSLLWALESVTLLGQADKGPVVAEHGDVEDQGNQAETVAEWVGTVNEAGV